MAKKIIKEIISFGITQSSGSSSSSGIKLVYHIEGTKLIIDSGAEVVETENGYKLLIDPRVTNARVENNQLILD